MSTLTQTFARPGSDAPRRWWRRALGRLLALDELHRERHALEALDARMLRDIGVTRSDIESTLGRPEDHLRLVLLRGAYQSQR